MSKIGTFIKKRKAGLIQLGISLLLLCISASIGIFLGLKKTNDVYKYVDEVVSYYRDNDWPALYKFTESEPDDFVNEYFFEEMADRIYGEIDEETLKLVGVDEKNGIATVKLSFTTVDGINRQMDIELIEKPEKNYLFFNQWKINLDYLIVNDCKVTAPSGFEMYLDGVLLTEDNAVKTEVDGNVTYTIPKVYNGDHTIYVKKEKLEVFEGYAVWNEDQCEYHLDTSFLKPNQDGQQLIKSNSEKIIQLMYKAVFENAGIDEIKPYFAEDEATITSLLAVYDEMIAAITPEDGSTLSSISISSFSESEMQLDYPDKVDTSTTFECTFNARGPRKTGGGVRDKYEGKASSEVKLHFISNGDKWLCDKLDMSCIDYSKPPEEEEEK